LNFRIPDNTYNLDYHMRDHVDLWLIKHCRKTLHFYSASDLKSG